MTPQGNEWNLLYPQKHEDHIAGKGFTSDDPLQRGSHSFIPVPQAMKIPDAQAAVDDGIKKSSRLSQHGNWRKSRA